MDVLDHTGRPWRHNESLNDLPRDRWDRDLISGEMGHLAVPQVLTFSSLLGSAWKAYWHARSDEAYRDSRPDAIAMTRDPFLMGLLQERILATASLKWHLEGHNQKDPQQVELKDQVTDAIKRTPFLLKFIVSQLWALWYGKYANQIRTTWSSVRGKKTLTVAEWLPVNGDKIGHKWDGTPYILISAAWADRLPEAETFPTTLGRGLLLNHRWRERFVIHAHEVIDGDFYDAEAAESVYGVGIRSRLYWLNWIKLEYLEWTATFLERVGLGWTAWEYDATNPQSKAEVTENAKASGRKTHILVPVWPDGRGGKSAGGVTRVDPPLAGADALGTLRDKIDEIMERYVVGQEGSSSATSSSGHSNEASSEFMQDCVPVDSEILTRRGFVSPFVVQVGDEVLAYDVEADRCRWTPLLNKTFYENREVTRFFMKNRRFEVFCTSDHSWAVEVTRYRCDSRNGETTGDVAGPRGGAKPANQERRLIKAQEIGRKYNLILAAPEVGTTDSVLSVDEAALVGWLVTDGQHPKPGKKHRGYYICQSKDEHFDAIREMMSKFLVSPKEYVGKPTDRTFPTLNSSRTRPQHVWRLPRAVGDYILLKCGFQTTADLPGITTRLTSPARQAMLDAMMRADGGKDGSFFNTDVHLMEAFSILCALQGVSTGVDSVKAVPEGCKPCWVKRMKTSRMAYGAHIQREEGGRADIWCPTTQYGTWVMRQRGRVLITGNTKGRITLFDATGLQETLTGNAQNPGLVYLIQRYSRPETLESCPLRWVFDLESTESKDRLSGAKTIFDMGVALKADEVRGAGGFSKPVEGDEQVKKPDEQQQGPQQEQKEDPALAAQAQEQELKIDAQRHEQELAQKQTSHDQQLRHEQEKHQHGMQRETQKTAHEQTVLAHKAQWEAQQARQKAILAQQAMQQRQQQQAAVWQQKQQQATQAMQARQQQQAIQPMGGGAAAQAGGMQPSESQPVQQFSRHAPPGGVEVGGTFYKGGEFIPDEALAAVSPGARQVVDAQGRREAGKESWSPHDHWEDRSAQREDQRGKVQDAEGEFDLGGWSTAHETMGELDEDIPADEIDLKAGEILADFHALFLPVEARFRDAGATDKELTPFKKTLETAGKKVGEKMTTYVTALKKVAGLRQELATLEDAEPEEVDQAALDAAYPDEIDYKALDAQIEASLGLPTGGFTEDSPEALWDRYNAIVAEREAVHEAQQEAAEKADEKANAQHYTAWKKWEKKYDALNARAEAESEKVGDRFGDLEEAVEKHYSEAMSEAQADLSLTLYERIDAEEEADKEPDEEADEEELADLDLGDYQRRGQPEQYASRHAPPGGVTIKGKRYEGGEFIPRAVVEGMDWEEKIDFSARLTEPADQYVDEVDDWLKRGDYEAELPALPSDEKLTELGETKLSGLDDYLPYIANIEGERLLNYEYGEESKGGEKWVLQWVGREALDEFYEYIAGPANELAETTDKLAHALEEIQAWQTEGDEKQVDLWVADAERLSRDFYKQSKKHTDEFHDRLELARKDLDNAIRSGMEENADKKVRILREMEENDDPDGAKSDARIYNQELEKANSHFRIIYDEDEGDWFYTEDYTAAQEAEWQETAEEKAESDLEDLDLGDYARDGQPLTYSWEEQPRDDMGRFALSPTRQKALEAVPTNEKPEYDVEWLVETYAEEVDPWNVSALAKTFEDVDIDEIVTGYAKEKKKLYRWAEKNTPDNDEIDGFHWEDWVSDEMHRRYPLPCQQLAEQLLPLITAHQWKHNAVFRRKATEDPPPGCSRYTRDFLARLATHDPEAAAEALARMSREEVEALRYGWNWTNPRTKNDHPGHSH